MYNSKLLLYISPDDDQKTKMINIDMEQTNCKLTPGPESKTET